MTRIARIKMGDRDYPPVSPDRIDQQKEIEQEHTEITEEEPLPAVEVALAVLGRSNVGCFGDRG
jgi:hypothetical protein